jgi:fumarylacetoacetase
VSETDETHRPDLRSWVDTANDPSTDFPIQNLPLGVFRRKGSSDLARVGVAIGDQVLDVTAALRRDVLRLSPAGSLAAQACGESSLKALMAQGREASRELRRSISAFLRGSPEEQPAQAADVLAPQTDVELHLPVDVGDYTDFYASIFHATNVGSMFRPDNPLLPNYKYVPIGYHGRASSIVVSGSPVRRPRGQTRDDASGAEPVFGPTRRLDYELEVGAFIAAGNPLGEAIPIERASDHIFGLALLNDWSARDIQAWEYQPLGPFLSKSFATTLSPWVVTVDALAPFRVAAFERPATDPVPMPYLDDPADRRRGAFDIALEVYVSSRAMRDQAIPPLRLSRSRFAEMYWTLAQLVTHHASNGCNLRPGDLIGSGTVSGETKDSRGCLLELTWRGSEPIRLPTGETRRFLEDGDEVAFRAYCERDGWRRIGFGECSGVVSPSS